MKKTLATLISLMMLGSIAHAAPYYTGIGCNEAGDRCTFGKPSKRVLQWSRKGTTQELGERCEKFIQNIDTRKKDIASKRALELEYKKFTYSWSSDIDANGRAQIICNVELHSELENVKIVGYKVKSLFWVCESQDSAGICKNYASDCEQIRQEALKGENVLDATIYRGGSLLQGNICDIVTATVK